MQARPEAQAQQVQAQAQPVVEDQHAAQNPVAVSELKSLSVLCGRHRLFYIFLQLLILLFRS